MNKATTWLMTVTVFAAIGACGGPEAEPDSQAERAVAGHNAPEVTFAPAGDAGIAGKPSAPITISYRIIGTPVVGQPLAIDLQVASTLGSQAISLGYGINDRSALRLAESQPASITLAADKTSRSGFQQVTIIPMREGRSYLNVSASIETEGGSMSTVTAIPIQVGEGTRQMQENGELQTDAEGNPVRVMPAKEN